MPSRIILRLILLAFLIGACTTSKENTPPTLAAITMLPETNQGLDSQLKSSGGGEPRSSGYWLIWNTCAEGNQSETAKANGGREAGWILMEDLLADPGIFVGTLQIETCEQGLSLLQSRNIQNADMEKDAAYILAAQLFAAQLNLATGAKYCPASDQTVSQAQLLLLELNFDGTGGYLGPPLANAKMEEAKNLTEKLTNYNSGSLCVP